MNGPDDSSPCPVEAFIGVGSNLNSPRDRCTEAVDRLGTTEGIRVLGCSPWYVTAPVGPIDQPDFVNGVVRVESFLGPTRLLGVLQAIENAMGRERDARWGPRVIDLDLLLFGDMVREEEGLTIPHPEMQKRRFVLAPLCDLAPEGLHPVLQKSFQDLLDELGDEQPVSPLPG
jgi:2-amino-4-hydroxy-6-hydroxymethyldihydropteridine diphosphokinase